MSKASCQVSRVKVWEMMRVGSTWRGHSSHYTVLMSMGRLVTLPAATSASHASQVCQILRPCTVVRVSDLNSTLGIGSSMWMGALGIPIRTTRPPFRSKLGGRGA